jgi:murein DD-endopeptidase MepM/ murein hydrolase activator NlpD
MGNRGSALGRLGAAAVLFGLTACGARGDGPAPVVLGVPPAGGYYAAAAPYERASPPPAWIAAARPNPTAAWAAPSRPTPPVRLAELPPSRPPERPVPPLRASPRPRPVKPDSEAMAEVRADVARAAAARSVKNATSPRQHEVAAREPATTVARPPAAAARDDVRFLWPVHGRILAGFGAGPGGSHNDGINIAAPRGAPIEAADAGVVAYAGNELRGYGNLILVKHAHGWISAYAHCDVLLVRQGQKVARGQVIARVGSTGTVDAPQLHFELRHDSKPVDPRDFLGPPPTAAAGARDRSG